MTQGLSQSTSSIPNTISLENETEQQGGGEGGKSVCQCPSQLR